MQKINGVGKLRVSEYLRELRYYLSSVLNFRLIAVGRGPEVVELVKNISLSGRAAKQQPTMFALAVCARCNDAKTKKAAYSVINDVCRIPTHLFLFIKYCEENSSGTGWGRAHKRAIEDWYKAKAKNPKNLAKLLTKYKSRENWSHRDVFRLTHIKTENEALQVMVRFIIKGLEEAENLAAGKENLTQMIDYLKAAEKARKCTDEDEMVELIQKYGLEREHLTTQLLNSRKVWEALIETLKMTAIIRNLGKMTKLGIIEDGGWVEKAIVEKLTNKDLLKQARVHPFNVLVALNTYAKGRGDKGSLRWMPNRNIVDALDEAFYLSFEAVEPTNKRYLLAIDVSGSMNVPCIGSTSITCRDAAAAMMMVTARTEDKYDVVAFSHKLTKVDINKNDALSDVICKTRDIKFGGTDCALPMIWAQEQRKIYDVFIVYTDNETWYGKVHPSRALKDYRAVMSIPDAKLIVAGMASNGFTIADPDDFGMLDIVGFDSGATQTIAKFSLGEV